MIQLSLHDAAHEAQGSSTKDALFKGISIDTRTLQPGNLFVAIAGTQTDGHQYLKAAQEKGASAALVDHPITHSDLPQLIVKDTVQALGQLASAWRNRFTLPIVAVTGSNGKTTTKNMIAAILTAACDMKSEAVLATQGNFNNHLGLPLSLAGLSDLHQYAVIEMGMNHFGEIDTLTRLTKPTVAVITQAGPAHLEGVGDMAGVARAKAEIFNGLDPDGTAILNRDDAFYTYWQTCIRHHKQITFGTHEDASVSGHATLKQNTLELHIKTPIGSFTTPFALLGTHNVLNASAATAACLALNIPLSAIAAGLSNVRATPGRLHLHSLPNGAYVIDDTYNANPASFRAAIQTLSELPGKRILVMGDMKGLAEHSKAAHHAIGKEALALRIDTLFTFGEDSRIATEAFGQHATHCPSIESLITTLQTLMTAETCVLIKGSRAMRMERVVEQLCVHFAE